MRCWLEYSIGASKWQWYRKWRGGHWELCWIDPTMSLMWMRLNHDKVAASALRRSADEWLVRCEDW